MNKRKPSIDLESSRPSPNRPLELPFEKKPAKMLPVVAQPSAVASYLRKIEPIEPEAAHRGRNAEISSEMRSLYGAIDNVEDRLARRLDRLQQQLIAAKQKIQFQQRCFVIFILLCFGGICFALTRPPAIAPKQSSPQVQPSQINRLPLFDSYSA
ncbi:hypothetical protein [Oscillatoria sp. FACHB-1406]|uniref:hypothetical protein n=1 Tax=Oscillatoria sp. FACHB-1406 TaxID=2692846 RepID=UPI0016888DE4|nr:hypothetical protein [Oscillatoria sp. FACHB-1406]MBD2577987.1 hypothetical protein [Oscillatoria sp. FACHB-1406]